MIFNCVCVSLHPAYAKNNSLQKKKEMKFRCAMILDLGGIFPFLSTYGRINHRMYKEILIVIPGRYCMQNMLKLLYRYARDYERASHSRMYEIIA